MFLLALWVAPGNTQTISGTTYPFSNSSGQALADMSTGTTTLLAPNLDDNASAVTPIGFDFWFVGTRYALFSVNANGLLRLGSSAVGGTFTNDLATATNVPQIAPYWDDLFIGTNGKVHYRVVGSAPNRKLVVEWLNMQVPRVGAGTAGAAVFQCWLSETSGQIDFVYGNGMGANGVNGGASIGFGSSAGAFASVTASGPTVAYGSANNSNAGTIAAGTIYSFVPPRPAAPSGLTTSGVSATALTLHWTDNATNEIGYAVYRSTDGVNYSFLTQLPTNSTSLSQTGLMPSTSYSWSVQALTEGALSNPLVGTFSTTAAGAVIASGSGNWSSTTPDAPWPGGVLPTPSDDVTIADGLAVTIDTPAACHSLTVGQGSSGRLEFEPSTARTLTVGADVHVLPGAILRSATSGTQTGHVLSVGGDLLNDGTLDFSTNGNGAGARITFTGVANSHFGGAGGTTNVRAITVDKGTSFAPTVTLEAANFTVQGSTLGAPPFLTLTNGTLRISGTSALSTALFGTAAYSIGATSGLWLDNPNLVVTAQSGSPLLVGLLRVSAGALHVGTAADQSFGLASGSTVVLEGGQVDVTGRFAVTSATGIVTYGQTGGSLTANTLGQTSTTLASFDLGTSASSSVSISGGSILLRLAGTSGVGPRDFRNRAGIQNVTGGTLVLGDFASGPSQTFVLSGTVPGVTVSNTSAAHAVSLFGATTSGGTTLLNPGTSLNLNGFRWTQFLGSFVNQGTVIGSGGSSELYFLGTTVPQTYSGSGAIVPALRGAGLSIDNPAGVTIDPAIPGLLRTTRVNLVRGTLHNSQLVSLGDTSLTATTQMGAVGLADPGGAYDTFPTIHPLAAGVAVQYLQEGGPRTTGFEIPATRTLSALTVNNGNGVTVAGGGLTVTGTATLTTGVITTTSANLLTFPNSIASPPAGSAACYVDGPLGIQFTVSSATTRTFAIGASGAYRPLVLKSVNTAGVARTFTAQVIPVATGGSVSPPLQSLTSTRYWRITNSAQLNATARVNLTFGADDNAGALTNARVAQAASAGGNYSNLGGVTTGSQSAGTVESNTNLTPGSDYFAIASNGSLATTWDGGAGTNAWGDAANWNPDGVPGSGTSVSLVAAAPTTINVNGTFSVGPLTLGANTALALGSGSLAVNGDFNQSAGSLNGGSGTMSVSGVSTVAGGTLAVSGATFTATGAMTATGGAITIAPAGRLLAVSNLTISGGTLSLGSGTLEVQGALSRTAGTLDSGSGLTILSGANTQAIGASLTFYDLTLRNGGAGKPKRFTGSGSYTVNGNFTVEGTAQIAVSTSDPTELNVWGDWNYLGLAGGTNITALKIRLHGSGKTINGAAPAGMAAPLASVMRNAATDKAVSAALASGPGVRVDYLTDPALARRVGTGPGGKPRIELENTLERRRGDVERLLHATDPSRALMINLDDVTLTRNPAGSAPLSPEAAAPSATVESGPAAEFGMPVVVESGATYSLGGNLSVAAGQPLTVAGRIECGTATIGGAGGVSVLTGGILATAANSPAGLAATVVTSGTNSYSSGAIIDYDAAGAQTIHAASHPAAALIRTSGSGTKTLDADETITGSSAPGLDSGALFVSAGTTFADGGHRLSFTTPEFANVVILGGYASSGAGSLSYESGPFESGILAADGTAFGDLLLNFTTSAFTINLNASGTAGYSVRNLVLGGTAGSGTAGGTLRLSQTGTTNLTVTGNVSITPAATANSGGGFSGTSGHSAGITLLGNVTSNSASPTQPFVDANGANRLVFGGSSPQTVTFAGDGTLASGATLALTNPSGLTLGGSGRTYSIADAGTLDLGNAQIATGTNTLALGPACPLTRGSGRIVGRLKKAVPVGSPTATFEIGSATFDTPVSVGFSNVTAPGNLAASTTAGDHASLASSGIDPAKSVNRVYTLDNEGIAFDSAAVSLEFASSDVDPGANPAAFVVERYNAPTWTFLAPGSRSGLSTQATGNTAFGDFAVGEARIHTIVASAGAHGSITPAGATPVNHGASQLFTIVPDADYHVASVLVDGVSVGTPTTYTFASVTADHTIDVSFAIDQYVITATAGPNGSISPAGSVVVDHGADQTFLIAAATNFTLEDVVVDGVSQGPVAEYTFHAVAAPHIIAASFVAGAIITAGPPADVISGSHPCVAVPVTLQRATAQPVRAFSVDVTLSPGLTLCAGTASITEGTFLSALGPTAYFVTDLGGGAYTVDCTILGSNCGVTSLSGTLFTIHAQSALASGAGSIAVTGAKLRDCSNTSLFVTAGAPTSVPIDHVAPAVTLLAPNGGSVATIGSSVPITWLAADSAGVATVDLALSTDGGSTYPDVIAGAIANTGLYSWVVPNLRSTQARVRVTAHDVNGNVASDASDGDFEIREANVAPVLAAIGNRVVDEGQLLGWTASATDANLPAQTLRYSLDAGFPPGAALDSVTGAFTWTPTEAQGPGDYPLTVRVTDDGSPALSASETISIHVNEVNSPPLLSSVPAAATLSEQVAYTFTALATDADLPAQPLTFSLVGGPPGAEIDGATGHFTWTPGEAQGPGTYPFAVRVSDGVASTDSAIVLTVLEVNVPPTVAGVPPTAAISEGVPYEFTATASDADLPAQAVTFSVVGAPAGASIDSSTGAFTWTPTEAQGPGVYAFQVQASDGVATTDAATTLTVLESNVAPVLAGVPTGALIPEQTPYTFTATATDADLPPQTLIFSLVGAPVGAAIDGSTGAFTWTPSEAQGPGVYSFSVQVSDGNATTAASVTLTVEEVNAAPFLAGVPASATIPEQVPYTFTATATDADLPAQTLTFSLVGTPVGASIDGSTGVFTWTPTEAQGPGVYPFDVQVTDGLASATATITLTVSDVNLPPAIAGVPANVTIPELAPYTFTATATDADLPAQTLTFSLVDAPAGASVDNSTGAFTWTPTEAQGPGVYPFAVRVSDGASSTATTITVTVEEMNLAPVIGGLAASASIPEQAPYTFTATATDADLPAQALHFSLVGAPVGAAIDSSTGAFSWTPTEAQGPGVYPFSVRVSDGIATSDSAVTLSVLEVNLAPVLAGVPASATIPEQTPYTFTATATDADLPAQPLTFSLVGAPAGASIDGSTGTFTWTPTAAQSPGVYPLSVHVGDGVASAEATITLTVESVTVAPIADLAATRATSGDAPGDTTSIVLSWTPPAGGGTVEVYRAPFGGYPRYDDAGGHVPAPPTYPPAAPWTLTGVTSPGGRDHTASRDFYYYVAFVHGPGMNVSAASNRTPGTLNYQLGDVSDGTVIGHGDNRVDLADITLLGAHYGISGASVDAVAYLDVGPTIDLSTSSRPQTDRTIDFEDLLVFALNFQANPAAAQPDALLAPRTTTSGSDEVHLETVGGPEVGGNLVANVILRGSGAIHGLSTTLTWDPTVVRPVGVAPGDLIVQAGGIVLSPSPGSLDAAVLGQQAPGLSGEGSVGSVSFEVLAAGDPGLRIASVRGRDASNQDVVVSALVVAVPSLPTVSGLSRAQPNPFQGATAFTAALTSRAPLDVVVYAVDGRRVRTLAHGVREPGAYRLVWDGRDESGQQAPAGIYFVRMVAGRNSFRQSIVYIR